jgi:hypothetical protein
VQDPPAEAFQPTEGGVFDNGFSEGRAQPVTTPYP